MLHSVLFWLFVVVIAIQCGYALYFFTRVLHLPKQPAHRMATRFPVSVVVCAKNEARNLEQHLPSILAQRYRNEAGEIMYEVVVVNDASQDDTECLLNELQQQYPHLRHLTINAAEPRKFKGKKLALSKGVEAAKHPWLLLTDADCAPASDFWLQDMTASLAAGKEIVAGYGAHKAAPGWLNAFIRWETMHSFLQYSTYALAGKPFMAVGRNLACTKRTFLNAQQSEIWNILPSGDDDLLMRLCATKHNTSIVASPEAFTFSAAKNNFNDWLRQKQRHVSTGKLYRTEIKALLATYAFSHALMWLLFFFLFLTGSSAIVFLLMLMRCSIYWTIWQTTALKLCDRKLFRWLALCDVGWAVYNFVLSPYIIWKNKQQWK